MAIEQRDQTDQSFDASPPVENHSAEVNHSQMVLRLVDQKVDQVLKEVERMIYLAESNGLNVRIEDGKVIYNRQQTETGLWIKGRLAEIKAIIKGGIS